MQLLKLTVTNWVHHRKRTCNFTRGLVAILGENGSGKSSLFGALRWLLTGENPNYGVKSDNVSQYAKDGEPANAVLEFEHNGHTAVVQRHLLPEKEQSLLMIDGVEVARGDKAVTAGIEKLLGVDAKFISRFIIVPQTEIFSFIDDNQTDTDKFFQRLFNTAKADKCQDAIGKSLLKLSVPDVVKTSGQLQIEREQLDAQLTALVSQIAELPSFDVVLSAQEEDQKTIADWERREQLTTEIAALSTDVLAQQEQLEQDRKTLASHEADLLAFSDAIAGKEAAHRAAKIALGHWENYKNISALKTRLHAQRAELETARQALQQPAPLTGPTSAELQSAQVACQNQIDSLASVVSLFSADGVAACPTCHTPTADLSATVTQYKTEKLPALRAELGDLNNKIAARIAAEAATLQWQKKQDELAAKEKHIDESEVNLNVVRPPETAEDDLQQAVSDFEDFQFAQHELEPVVAELRDKISSAAGGLKLLVAQVQKAQEARDSIVVTAADAETARIRIESLREKCAERQRLSDARQRLLFDLERLDADLEATINNEAIANSVRGWTTIATDAREALKNAPRIVAQRNLQRLETGINELLQIFRVNFLIRASNEKAPSFIAEFFDGRTQPAQRLSIGQKTVLALAFRVAVNAMFAEEIGLLALDEPTASLDQTRVQALAPVLEKLRDLSTAKGLQCLLVTHATSLSHLFESTIELEPPELRNVRSAG
jgi:DNA repair exonuclease SbcCD ATPase subunit